MRARWRGWLTGMLLSAMGALSVCSCGAGATYPKEPGELCHVYCGDGLSCMPGAPRVCVLKPGRCIADRDCAQLEACVGADKDVIGSCRMR